MYNEIRRKTREVKISSLHIGGSAPIAIQSMTNTDTHNREETLGQVVALQNAGCDIVRLALPDIESAATLSYLKENGVAVPLVADIHFDYRIALAAIENGADKIRINPGNIGSREKVEKVVRACMDKQIPIRIGVNSGSLEKHILEKYGAPTAEALAESALYHTSILEDCGFYNTVISVKSSDVRKMIAANEILAEKTNYPIHLGVTEAGGAHIGTMKSAIGIGTLLSHGIGDTIRVSLTADPLREVLEAKTILDCLGFSKERSMNIISCPTCGRTKIDLIPLLEQFEEELDRQGLRQKPLTVAFMGCVVNGPGEAKEADIGIAGGNGEAVLFKHGSIVKKIPANEIISTLLDEIKRM